MNIFDHVKNLTKDKIKWEDLKPEEQKTFSPYMIDRIFSMNIDLIPFVSMIQQYTVGTLEPREVYKLYFHILPKMNFWSKYIKPNKKEKWNKELVILMCQYFQLSSREVLDYMDLLKDDDIKEICGKYGKTKTEIKKLMKA